MATLEMLSLKKLLFCPSCSQEYDKENDPVVWGCGHTVCYRCTLLKSRDSSSKCPVCGVSICASADFPVNVSLKKVCDLVSGTDTSCIRYSAQIKDELFDDQGFANFGLLTYIKNLLRDRVSSLHKIREALMKRVTEADLFIDDFESKIGQLGDWEYAIVSRNSPEDLRRQEDMKQYMVHLQCLLKCTEVLNEPLLEKQKAKHMLSPQTTYVYHNVDGKDRWGRLCTGEDCFFMYAMTMNQEPPEYAPRISFQDLISHHDQSKTEVFLDLHWEDEVHGRVHMEVFEHHKDSLAFTDRCTFGKAGSFLKGVPLSSLLHLESGYDTEDGTEGSGSSSDEQNDFYGFEEASPVCSIYSSFHMCSNKVKSSSNGIYKLSLHSGFAGRDCLGTITKGLILLKYALLYNDVETVVINDCGLVLREEKRVKQVNGHVTE